MTSLDVPDYFTSISGLGRLVDYFPLRRQRINRITSLALAFICLLGAVVTVVLAVMNTYDRYYRFGPAVVLKSISVPALGVLILLAVGAAGVIGAVRTWNKGAAVFTGGLAVSDLRGVHAWRWEDISSIKVDIIHRQLSDEISSMQHTYTLTDNNGKRLILDESIARVEQLGNQIREKVMPLLITRYSTAFHRGQAVHFGPVSISLRDGVRTRKHVYPWETFQSVNVQKGVLNINFNEGQDDGKRLALQAAEIPNLEVLLSLLDMKKRATGAESRIVF